MKPWFRSTVALVSLSLWSSTGTADPAPAPDVMITLDGGLVRNSSSNFGPAIKQKIGDYNDAGPCHAANDWATCDGLRFGLSVHSGPACTDADPLTVMYDPGEDVGIDFVAPRLNGISSEDGNNNATYCGDRSPTFRNQDTAQAAVWQHTFPGTTMSTEAQLDAAWSRPNLQIFVTDGFPQSANGNADNRMVNTINQVCQMYVGPSGLPSMPTWVFVERNDGDPEVVWGGLVAAAGGTGECQWRNGNSWVDIDVCSHIGTVNETTLRQRINTGKYRCGAGGETYKVGGLDYENAPGNQGRPVIGCHLSAGTGCNSKPQTNLLGILLCVRQLPRGVAADDAIILYCEDVAGVENCTELTEANGDLEWIDDNRTLFVLTDKSQCIGNGSITITTCEPDLPCDTGLPGRCAAGLTDCSTGTEVCQQVYEAYPEICNGLDDDCDGTVDLMSDSWERAEFANYSLPDEHTGLDCHLQNICVCGGGLTDTHDGSSWDEYLDSWDAVCLCGEGLEAPASTPEPMPAEPAADSACSSVATDSLPASAFFGLLVLGLLRINRRRRSAAD